MTIVQSTKDLIEGYRQTMHKIADLRYAGALLQWDQETYLPPKGAPRRGQQIATLSELAHHYFTDPGFGDLLRTLLDRNDVDEKTKRNIELSFEDYTRQTRFSSEFVRKLSETINKSFHSWIHARKENSFKHFATELEPLIQLKRQEADFLGFQDHPYNALLDEYDKGATVSTLDKVFGQIHLPLKNLLGKINSGDQIDDSFLKKFYPKDLQWKFGMELLKELGYDFEAGRQDISEHPFSINFNSNDVRITTRIHENDLGSMTWSCIHELGHALYEQGLPDDQYGLPLGEAASLSIHESQSRLWENQVGRSIQFCEKYLPLLKTFFPEQLDGVEPREFFKAINKVQPSFIRTEADELTYHFHVMIRYELEKELISGTLSCAEIPSYWNTQYQKYLGVIVDNDRDGCLQDVHWSHGSFGYFPTYSLGSFYSAQFFDAAKKQQPAIATELESGNTASLLQWLRNNIHIHGRAYPSEQLCLKVTGETLNIQHFISYLSDKYHGIYNF